MSFGQTLSRFLIEIRENEYNRQFIVGDKIDFLFSNDTVYLSGAIIKKYTNSCLVDISQDLALSREDVDLYNGKVVVNYKKIEGVRHDESCKI